MDKDAKITFVNFLLWIWNIIMFFTKMHYFKNNRRAFPGTNQWKMAQKIFYTFYYFKQYLVTFLWGGKTWKRPTGQLYKTFTLLTANSKWIEIPMDDDKTAFHPSLKHLKFDKTTFYVYHCPFPIKKLQNEFEHIKIISKNSLPRALKTQLVQISWIM